MLFRTSTIMPHHSALLVLLAPLVRSHLFARTDPHTSDLVSATNTYSDDIISGPTNTPAASETFVSDTSRPANVPVDTTITLPTESRPIRPSVVGPGIQSLPPGVSLGPSSSSEFVLTATLTGPSTTIAVTTTLSDSILTIKGGSVSTSSTSGLGSTSGTTTGTEVSTSTESTAGAQSATSSSPTASTGGAAARMTGASNGFGPGGAAALMAAVAGVAGAVIVL